MTNSHDLENRYRNYFYLTDENYNEVADWILINNAEFDAYSSLHLLITNDGGEIWNAWALIDIIRSSDIPIHTYGLGQVCSSGLLIFIAGATRTVTPRTTIMSHQFSSSAVGTHTEMKNEMTENDNMIGRMEKYYKQQLDLPNGIIQTRLLGDFDAWITAEEAKRLGIATTVTECIDMSVFSTAV